MKVRNCPLSYSEERTSTAFSHDFSNGQITSKKRILCYNKRSVIGNA